MFQLEAIKYRIFAYLLFVVNIKIEQHYVAAKFLWAFVWFVAVARSISSDIHCHSQSQSHPPLYLTKLLVKRKKGVKERERERGIQRKTAAPANNFFFLFLFHSCCCMRKTIFFIALPLYFLLQCSATFGFFAFLLRLWSRVVVCYCCCCGCGICRFFIKIPQLQNRK